MPPIPVRISFPLPVSMMPSSPHLMPKIDPVPIILSLPLSVLIAPLKTTAMPATLVPLVVPIILSSPLPVFMVEKPLS
jgi:hypothetical protein